jgi:predicted MFS family arabinose efflux permease
VRKTVFIMWAAYALGSAGGMTVVSHVTGIMVSFAGSTTQAVGTVASCALGNWCGRILAGVGSDIFGPKAVIVTGALGASAILAALQCFFQGNAVAAQLGLTLMGLCFGTTLTAYPVLVRRMVRNRMKPVTGSPCHADCNPDRFHEWRGVPGGVHPPEGLPQGNRTEGVERYRSGGSVSCNVGAAHCFVGYCL